MTTAKQHDAVSFRQAKKSDIPSMEKLIEKSARGLSVGFYDEEQIESAIKYVFGIDSQLLEDETCFVGEIRGELIACGGWSKRKTLYGGDQFKKSTSDPLLDPKTEAARIRAFFVHPNYGRQGIGKMLLIECEQAAKKEGFQVLELGATFPGVPFYLMFGYQKMEPVELAFPNGVKFPIVRM